MRGNSGAILLLGVFNLAVVALLLRATALRGGLSGCGPQELRVAVVGARLCPREALQNRLVPLLEATWARKQAEGVLFVSLDGMGERVMAVEGHRFIITVNPGRLRKKVNVPSVRRLSVPIAVRARLVVPATCYCALVVAVLVCL